eukprot:scaffold33451_cov18-Tisochrysis_lutea.AAC.1
MQVHKAKLRGEEGGDKESKVVQMHGGPFRFLRGGKSPRQQQQQQQQQQQMEQVVVEQGQGAWDVCNTRGVTLDELADLNKEARLWLEGEVVETLNAEVDISVLVQSPLWTWYSRGTGRVTLEGLCHLKKNSRATEFLNLLSVDLDNIQPGQQLVVPQYMSISAGEGYEDRSLSGSRASSSSSSIKSSSGSNLSSSSSSPASSGRGLSAAQAAHRALATGVAPLDGIVAVKIQCVHVNGALGWFRGPLGGIVKIQVCVWEVGTLGCHCGSQDPGVWVSGCGLRVWV